MPKRPSKRSVPVPGKYKRARKNNANVSQDTSQQANQGIRLALIAEVKKYPILCTSLDVDEDSETCYGAWEKIAEELQRNESTSQSPMDCIKIWKSIKRSFIRYIKADIHTRGAVIRAMQRLFPDFNEENLLDTVKDLDENGALDNSSEVGSDTAEEIMRPKTNHTPVRRSLSRTFVFAFIAEVKKYPTLYTSLDVDGDSETFYGAWEKIAEALHIDDSMSTSPVDYCRKYWKIIKSIVNRFINGYVVHTSFVKAMLDLFPEWRERKNDAMNNSSEGRSVTAENNNAAGPEPNSHYPAGTEFELALIAEVKKYPVISKSLNEDIYSKRCYNAWEKIAEALQIKAAHSDILSHINYCRSKWLFIIDSFIRYYSGDPYKTNEVVMQAMQSLYPECNDVFADSTSESDCQSEESYHESRSKKRTAAAPTEEPMCESADENDELNNSSEAGSATAESAEEVVPPTTNDAAGPEPQPLRKRLHFITKQLVEFTCSDGRQPILAFMEKPSKTLYPAYYNEIDKPIDMITIEANIKNDRYNSLEKIISDFRLMFSNCRRFNEEGSLIYEDACLLEAVMYEKLKELNCSYKMKMPSKPLKKKLHFITKQLVEFTCSDGRQPILAFMEKPSKTLYPAYYNEIDKPIDMITIEANIKNDRYNSLEEMISDYRLMFSNCRRFNEEGSPIYEAANLLERVMNEKLKELNCSYKKKTPSADENNELNNSSEAGSATAESAEEVVPPTTNDAAGPEPQQAATPGKPRSMGARSTERAVSLAVVDLLFDSLHSAAARTDVCNSLIQLVHQYHPNVLSDVIDYGARQADLFKIDWSGLPIPEDLCREIWRRDAEEKLRKANKTSSSKRRAKKQN